MSDHDIDPARAALIDRRIAQTFAFLRDVIEEPQLLEDIPEGSELRFRDVVWHQTEVRLTAHPSKDYPGYWTARITGPASIAVHARHWEVPEEFRGKGMGGKYLSPPPFPEVGSTPESALNALEEKLAENDQADQVRARMVKG
jgi:hypothetical protein